MLVVEGMQLRSQHGVTGPTAGGIAGGEEIGGEEGLRGRRVVFVLGQA